MSEDDYDEKEKGVDTNSDILMFRTSSRTHSVARSTLLMHPECFLSKMLLNTGMKPGNEVSFEGKKYYFVDRDDRITDAILEYMRNGYLNKPFGISEKTWRKNIEYFGFQCTKPLNSGFIEGVCIAIVSAIRAGLKNIPDNVLQTATCLRFAFTFIQLEKVIVDNDSKTCFAKKLSELLNTADLKLTDIYDIHSDTLNNDVKVYDEPQQNEYEFRYRGSTLSNFRIIIGTEKCPDYISANRMGINRITFGVHEKDAKIDGGKFILENPWIIEMLNVGVVSESKD